MLVALRDTPLGDGAYKAGDHIPPEIQLALPPGRLRQLKEQRYVEEQDFEKPIGPVVEALSKRVDALEKKAAQPATTRKPKEAKA